MKNIFSKQDKIKKYYITDEFSYNNSVRNNFENDIIIDIYEIPPAPRTLRIVEDVFIFLKHQDYRIFYENFHRINLPYLYFCTSYIKTDDEKDALYFLGQPGAALQIFASKEKINSIDDKVELLSFENRMNGVICLSHKNDNKYFYEDKFNLSKNFFSTWLGQQHSVFACKKDKIYYDKKYNTFSKSDVIDYWKGNEFTNSLEFSIEKYNAYYSFANLSKVNLKSDLKTMINYNLFQKTGCVFL